MYVYVYAEYNVCVYNIKCVMCVCVLSKPKRVCEIVCETNLCLCVRAVRACVRVRVQCVIVWCSVVIVFSVCVCMLARKISAPDCDHPPPPHSSERIYACITHIIKHSVYVFVFQ